MADMQAFEYLCRVCASDTKGKSSVAECVYVLKTEHLKEKIKKYIDLTVSEDDALPKVICKSCYRSVEGIVSLSKIAVHTQMVLSNFLKPHSVLANPDSEFTTIVSPVKDYGKTFRGTGTTNATTPPTVATQIPKEKPKRAEEVVVNVSVSDPLTRETQQKIIGASRQRQTLLDSRFIPKSIAHRHVSFATSTPKDLTTTTEAVNLNLAKKRTTTPPPQQQQPQSAGGVINFFNPQQPQQQVTITSGGYVIGQMNGATNSSSSTSVNSPHPNENEQQKRKNIKMSLKNMRNANNTGQVSLLKVSQKPSSLIVNPSLSDNSLLDSPPPPQQPSPLNYNQRPRALSPPLRRARKQPQRRPTIAEIPSTVEGLPREIIIASVKKPKHRNPPQPPPETATTSIANVNQTTPPPPGPGPPPPLQAKPNLLQNNRPEVQQQQQQQQQPTATEQPVIPKSLFPDDIPLGRVIRDFDLLKLIMKALKWPVGPENMDMLMDRLRNSKFTSIMSDPNLLQDNDLTQLLGPYLAPVLMAAQALQQQQNIAANIVSPAKTIPIQKPNKSPVQQAPADLSVNTANSNLARAIPYRLPPETSVQLVPASPEEERAEKINQHNSRKSGGGSSKRSRRPLESSPRPREISIVISDGEDETPSNGSKSSNHSNTNNNNNKQKSNQKRSKTNVASDEMASYDALKQLAERSRAALERVTPMNSQRARSGAETATLPASPPPTMYPSFVDDIVLIEPEPTPSQTISNAPKAQDSLPSVISMTSPDNLFQARALPPITRPIIKRRKTVIHSSAANKVATLNTKPVKPTTDAVNDIATAATPVIPTKADKTENLVAAAVQVPSSVTANDAPNPKTVNVAAGPEHAKINVATSMSFFDGVTKQITAPVVSTATSTATATVTEAIAAETLISATAKDAKDAKETPKKPVNSKAALAEQLLEAVGLKKANADALEKPPNRESVQQIRSALKRSLKQAVEQNLRKQEELPIKQDADSTTKNLSKDLKLPTEPVDIEDEIEKVTLQKTDRQLSLLKSKMQEPATKARNTNRNPRKPANQTSVIKIPNTNVQNKEEANFEPKTEDTKSMLESKNACSQTSPVVSENADETIKKERGSIGQTVSSTSESKTIIDTKGTTNIENANKKKGRKRKVLEELGEEIGEVVEDIKKKEIKSENDMKPIEGGDGEVVKELTSNIDLDRKPEGSGSSSSTRPTRQSKNSSKYYKGPDKPVSSRPTRSTRNK